MKKASIFFLFMAFYNALFAQEAIFTAIDNNDSQALKTALVGAKINDGVAKEYKGKNCKKMTPLLYAIISEKQEMVLELLRQKANPNASSNMLANYSGCEAKISNYTPLIAAAETGNIEIIKLLIRAKADTQKRMKLKYLDAKCRLKGNYSTTEIEVGPQGQAEAHGNTEAMLVIRKAKGSAWSKEPIK